ncbi:hypothetical protein HDZ31DRAFT_41530 [Schizophyllum fasciatum]
MLSIILNAARRTPLQPTVRALTTSAARTVPHTPDSYAKDVDQNAPEDTTTHRVDSSGDSVQRPHEAPQNKYSETGVDAGVDAYKSVDKKKPYDAPGEPTRYGGRPEYAKDNKGEIDEYSKGGPDSQDAGGRKPEGR